MVVGGSVVVVVVVGGSVVVVVVGGSVVVVVGGSVVVVVGGSVVVVVVVGGSVVVVVVGGSVVVVVVVGGSVVVVVVVGGSVVVVVVGGSVVVVVVCVVVVVVVVVVGGSVVVVVTGVSTTTVSIADRRPRCEPGRRSRQARDRVDGSLRNAGPAVEVGLHAEIVQQDERSSIPFEEGGRTRRVHGQRTRGDGECHVVLGAVAGRNDVGRECDDHGQDRHQHQTVGAAPVPRPRSSFDVDLQRRRILAVEHDEEPDSCDPGCCGVAGNECRSTPCTSPSWCWSPCSRRHHRFGIDRAEEGRVGHEVDHGRADAGDDQVRLIAKVTSKELKVVVPPGGTGFGEPSPHSGAGRSNTCLSAD